jgi:uncharacterized protein
MEVDYPTHVDLQGRTALTGPDDHLRDLVEQVLFTTPGERVNRPDFGTGLLQLAFEPNSEPLASATRVAVQAALQRALGELIEVREVLVAADDAALQVTVGYLVRRTGATRRDSFAGAP